MRAGISQREIAETLGVYQATISRIEQGHRLTEREQALMVQMDKLLPPLSVGGAEPLTPEEHERLEKWLRERARSDDPVRSYVALDALRKIQAA